MKFIPTLIPLLVSYLNLIFGWRLTNADNLSYKEILEKKGSNFKKMRFNEQTRRAWDSIINSAYSSSQSSSFDQSRRSTQAYESSSSFKNRARVNSKSFGQELNPSNVESKKKNNNPFDEKKLNGTSDNIYLRENIGNGIMIGKKTVQEQVDERYKILRPYDGIINSDNSVRFYVMDTSSKESLIMKLFFKGDAKNGRLYNEAEDPSFKDSIEDCKASKIIANRVFGKPIIYKETIDETEESPVYSNFEMTRCMTSVGTSGGRKAFYSIFTLPQGENLSKKCLHDLDLNKDNSCINNLKLISSSIINGIKLLNSGNSYFKHGNIRPNNIHIFIRNDTQKIYLDNMIYDKYTYDNINDKPLKYDFNLLGETLLQLLSGTSKTENVITNIPDSAFQIYYQIRKYFLKHNIKLNLKIAALNVEDGIFDCLGKCVTKAEFEYKLKKSIFNFIYRLKCSGINPTDQFLDVDQALNHDFIRSARDLNNDAKADSWELNPADY